jgi:hypothetical protein
VPICGLHYAVSELLCGGNGRWCPAIVGLLSAISWPANGTQARLPGLIVVCFGRFWVRGLPFPNARHLGHPFQWKNTLPWHLGPAAKVGILRFKDLPPFRHYRGLQNHVCGIHQGWPRQLA